MTNCRARACPNCSAPMTTIDELCRGAGRRQNHSRRELHLVGDPALADNPTIELRVADSCTRLDDAIAIAALFRCLVRALDRDRALNAGFDRVGRAITAENKWHAQRYGIAATFVDPFSPLAAHARAMARSGARLHRRRRRRARLRSRNRTSRTNRQRRHQRRPPDRDLRKAMAAGRQRLTALKEVVDWAAPKPRRHRKAETAPYRASPCRFRATYKARQFHARSQSSAGRIHGQDDLRPQRTQSEPARHARAGKIRPRDARRCREALPRHRQALRPRHRVPPIEHRRRTGHLDPGGATPRRRPASSSIRPATPPPRSPFSTRCSP